MLDESIRDDIGLECFEVVVPQKVRVQEVLFAFLQVAPRLGRYLCLAKASKKPCALEVTVNGVPVGYHFMVDDDAVIELKLR